MSPYLLLTSIGDSHPSGMFAYILLGAVNSSELNVPQRFNQMCIVQILVPSNPNYFYRQFYMYIEFYVMYLKIFFS